MKVIELLMTFLCRVICYWWIWCRGTTGHIRVLFRRGQGYTVMDVGNDQITFSEEDQGERHRGAIGDKDIVTGYRHDSHESPGNIRFTIAENLLQSVGHQRTVLVSWAHSRCYPVWLPQIQSQEFWRLHRICLRRRHCNLTGLLSNIHIFELGLTVNDILAWR